jgi:hypothetical protein
VIATSVDYNLFLLNAFTAAIRSGESAHDAVRTALVSVGSVILVRNSLSFCVPVCEVMSCCVVSEVGGGGGGGECLEITYFFLVF